MNQHPPGLHQASSRPEQHLSRAIWLRLALPTPTSMWSLWCSAPCPKSAQGGLNGSPCPRSARSLQEEDPDE